MVFEVNLDLGTACNREKDKAGAANYQQLAAGEAIQKLKKMDKQLRCYCNSAAS